MMRKEHQRKVSTLCGLILIAMAYGGLRLWLPTLTGNPLMDGAIGIVLGLYICSHPAANAVDLLFFQRYSLQQLTSGWSGLGWLALNLLALLMGWLMIATGAARLAARTA
jgi:hypothetical protein